MTLLERRYRAVLRLLPAAYRAEREEEMVAAFLELSGDVPDEESPRPRWGEVASVLALSVRLRLGGPAAAPRSYARGRAVRLLALLGLGFQASMAVAQVLSLALTSALGIDPFPGAYGSAERLAGIADAVVNLSAPVAFAAIMRGRVRLARVAALLSLAPVVGHAAASAVTWPGPFPLPADVSGVVVAAVPVIALFLGFHRDSAPRRHPWRPALLTPVAGGVALFLPQVALAPPFWVDPFGLGVVALTVASVAVLARGRSASRALALAGAGVLLLLARLPLLAQPAPGAEIGWQCAVLGVLITLLTVAGVRALPRPGAPAGGGSR